MYYVTEVFPDGRRAFGAGLAVTGYQLGISTINAVATVGSMSWQAQVFVVSLVCLSVAHATWALAEESPRWYIQRGQLTKAEEILRRLHVMNHRSPTCWTDLSIRYRYRYQMAPEPSLCRVGPTPLSALAARSTPLLRRVALLCSCGTYRSSACFPALGFRICCSLLAYHPAQPPLSLYLATCVSMSCSLCLSHLSF